jgi:glycosyl hydrolase family 71
MVLTLLSALTACVAPGDGGTGSTTSSTAAASTTSTTAASTTTSSATASSTSPSTTATTAPATTAEGPLPFDLPSTETLRGSDRLVFAHYFTPYPISLDNRAADVDYYTRNYLNPDGEGGIHAAYGGLLRDRPQPRAPLTGSWELQDMESEVRTAIAAGIDGFTVDLLNLSATSAHRRRVDLLIQAAEQVDPGFRIVLMPDMTATQIKGLDAAGLAAALAELAASPAVHRLDDGRLVVSPFKAENQSAAWWTEVINHLEDDHGLPVALVPVFLNFGANASAFAPISYGFSNWGNRSPNLQGSIAGNINTAHNLGRIWMQPVSVQDARPNQAIYDEANNSENLRTTWRGAIDGGADWVQLTTWNDYSETTQFAPSTHNDHSWLDISSYYLTWFKTGQAPATVRDTLYVTHRVQLAAARPTSGNQTRFMVPRSGTSTPRDTVEVLAFLTGSASVHVDVGSVDHDYSAAAGVSATTFPLAYGAVGATAQRAGTTTATATSPFPVLQDFVAQDLQYTATSSRR